MDDLQPLLATSLQRFSLKPQAFVHFTVIQLFSVVNFFVHTALTEFLVLYENNGKFVIPFVLNIFTENQIVLYITNSILSVCIVSILLKSWRLDRIAAFACCVGWISNALTWLILFLFSFIDKAFTFRVCGSVSTLIALAEALVYASGASESASTSVPYEFFWLVVIIAIGTFSSASISAVISVFISYWLLTNFQAKFGFTRNEGFSYMSFVKREKKEERDFNSIVDSLGLTESPELSEVDRNRRMRALRAIEERLESFQATP